MDSLIELRAAFAKVIVSYRNKKVAENLRHLDIDSFVNAHDSQIAIKRCVDEVFQIEPAKMTHLALFYKIFLLLDILSNKHIPKDDVSRLSLRDEIITILQKLYYLNHTGDLPDVTFSGVLYKLSTTKTWFGNLTDIGSCIREYLLTPLGASSSSVPPVNSKLLADLNIKRKISTFFDSFKLQEKVDQDKVLLDKQLAQQAQKLQLLQQQLSNTDENHDLGSSENSEYLKPNIISSQSSRSNSVTSGVGLFDNNSFEDADASGDEVDIIEKKNTSSWSLSSLWS